MDELRHGTPAEIESWLRALAAGRAWHPHAGCILCRYAEPERLVALTAGRLARTSETAGGGRR